MKDKLIRYQKEAAEELRHILRYWSQYAVDAGMGGFYGEVGNDNMPDVTAEKGSVLNARILWAFSKAYNHTKDAHYLPFAERACRYIADHFIDGEYGGVYWTVTAQGNFADTRKQVYAQAFCIYALSEYYKATKEEEVLQHAVSLFELMEQYSFDKEHGGYYEAFDRSWKPLQDVRLSEKDQNDVKTMNTHLHIAEAYASLYRVWPAGQLKIRVQHLLDCFSQHIIDRQTNHLNLFFQDDWKVNSSGVSFGHDIEAAWLLQECAESIKDVTRLAQMKEYAVSITNAALEGMDNDGGLFYEKGSRLVKEKHWWPQAEAMVGLLNAWQICGDEKYLQRSLAVWHFIKEQIRSATGEWLWGIDENEKPMNNYYKAGLWKCPYHNARACMEVAERIDKVLEAV